jgi:hypothetical protein
VKQETPLYRLERLLEERPNEVIWRFIMREDPFGYGWSERHDQACEELRGLYAKLDYDYHPLHASLSKQLFERVLHVERFFQVEVPLRDLEELVGDRLVTWHQHTREEVLSDINEIQRKASEGQNIQAALEKLQDDINAACEWAESESQKKKQQLDRLVSGLMKNRLSVGLSPIPEWGLFDRFILIADFGFFKTTIVEETKRYLDANWMHTPWLTNFVLVTLLDGDLASLAQLTRLLDPAALAEGLWRWIFWRKIFPWLQPLVYSGLAAAAIVGLFIFGLPWITPLVLGLLGWYYSSLLKWRIRFRRARRKLLQPAAALLQIRNEIASGLYNVSETLRRLRELEPQGVSVHSLAYSLLELA